MCIRDRTIGLVDCGQLRIIPAHLTFLYGHYCPLLPTGDKLLLSLVKKIVDNWVMSTLRPHVGPEPYPLIS